MNNEELILERLERIETQLAPLAQNAKSKKELKDDFMPLSNQAVQLMIKELEEVGKVEAPPSHQGKRIVCILAPK